MTKVWYCPMDKKRLYQEESACWACGSDRPEFHSAAQAASVQLALDDLVERLARSEGLRVVLTAVVGGWEYQAQAKPAEP